MHKQVYLIGVAGGSGSGKTTVVRKIVELLPEEHVAVIPQDAYYKDQGHITLEDRKKVNYDHPLAFDNELLIEQLREMLAGKVVLQPLYSFINYTRLPETQRIEPRPIYIIEGILVLEDPGIRELLDLKVYVDTDADVRFIRRLGRDIAERGRSVDSVISQYLEVVRPMHLQFIEPTKRYADVIVPEGGANEVAIDLLVSKIRSVINDG